MKKLLITSIMISGILSLCGCGNTSSSNSNSSTATTSTTTTSSEDTSEAAATTTTASSYNSSRIFTYNYVHGDEGYFNLLNDMPVFRKKLRAAALAGLMPQPLLWRPAISSKTAKISK